LSKPLGNPDRLVYRVLKWIDGLGCGIESVKEVKDYLREHVDMLLPLCAAVGAISARFPKTKFRLKVYRDPEIEDSYLQIVVSVSSQEIADEIMEICAPLFGKSGWLQIDAEPSAQFASEGRQVACSRVTKAKSLNCG